MKTVRVRVAVAVDPDGKWCAYGWRELDEGQAFDLCTEDMPHGEARYFLVAELPVPDIAEIQAEIEVSS